MDEGSRSARTGKSSTADAEVEDEDEETTETAFNGDNNEVVHVPNGLTVKYTYEHPFRSEILAVCYSARMRAYILLDGLGFLIWTPHAVEAKFSRTLNYNKYEYRRYLNFIYSPKFNVYFAYSKDAALKVLDWKQREVISVDASLQNMISCMALFPDTNQLITGSFGGFKVWEYRTVRQEERLRSNDSALFTLDKVLDVTGICDGFVRVISIDMDEQRLSMCTDYDIVCTKFNGTVLQLVKNAHMSLLSGVMYSPPLEVLVSAAIDAEIRVFNNKRALLHVFIGHTKPITALCPHPYSKKLFFTAARDGMVRLWSLDLLACVGMFLVFPEHLNQLSTTLGVAWQQAADQDPQISLFGVSDKYAHVWSINYVSRFWAKTRTSMRSVRLVGGPYTRSPEVPLHIVAVGIDNSVRLYRNEVEIERDVTMIFPPLNPRIGFQASSVEAQQLEALSAGALATTPRQVDGALLDGAGVNAEATKSLKDKSKDLEWLRQLKSKINGADDKELHVDGMAYFASLKLAFILVNNSEVWVYTTRTSPACRAMVLSAADFDDQQSSSADAAADAAADAGKSQVKIQSARALESVIAAVAANKIPIGTVETSFGVRTAFVPTSICAIENCLIVYEAKIEVSESEKDNGPQRLEVTPDVQQFLLLGLEDGRLLFTDPLAKGRKLLELKAHKDAIESITWNYIHYGLITMSRLKECCLFNFWKFPRLQLQCTIKTSLDFSTFAVLDSTAMFGHQSGHLTVAEFEAQSGSSALEPKKDKKVEHPGGVRAVDASPFLQFYATSGADGYVRLWTNKKVPVAEIALDDSIGALCFINEIGDLIVSYMQHLFLIEHSRFMRDTDLRKVAYVRMEPVNEAFFTVHEDPAVRYEFGKSSRRRESIDIFRYLAPYNVQGIPELSYLARQEVEPEDEKSGRQTREELQDVADPVDGETTSTLSLDACQSPRVLELDSHKYPQFGTSPTQTPEPEPAALSAPRVVSSWLSPDFSEQKSNVNQERVTPAQETEETQDSVSQTETETQTSKSQAETQSQQSGPTKQEKSRQDDGSEKVEAARDDKAGPELKDRLKTKMEEGFQEFTGQNQKESSAKRPAANVPVVKPAPNAPATGDAESSASLAQFDLRSRNRAATQKKAKKGSNVSGKPGLQADQKKVTLLSQSGVDSDLEAKAGARNRIRKRTRQEEPTAIAGLGREDDAEELPYLDVAANASRKPSRVIMDRKDSTVLFTSNAGVGLDADAFLMVTHTAAAGNDLPNASMRRLRPRTAVQRQAGNGDPDVEAGVDYVTDDEEPELMRLNSRPESAVTATPKRRVEVNVPSATTDRSGTTTPKSHAKSAQSRLSSQVGDAQGGAIKFRVEVTMKSKEKAEVLDELFKMPIGDGESRKQFLMRYVNRILLKRMRREECIGRIQENRSRLEEQREARLVQVLEKVEQVHSRYQQEKEAGFPSHKERVRIRIRPTQPLSGPSAPSSTPTPFAYRPSSDLSFGRSTPSELLRSAGDTVQFRIQSAASPCSNFVTSQEIGSRMARARVGSARVSSMTGRSQSILSLVSDSATPVASIPKPYAMANVTLPRVVVPDPRDDEPIHRITSLEQRLLSERFPQQYSQLVAALRQLKVGSAQDAAHLLNAEQLMLLRTYNTPNRSVSFSPLIVDEILADDRQNKFFDNSSAK